MSQTSLVELHADLLNEFGEELSLDEDRKSTTYSSPEIAELLLWNVLIAYVVNVVASGTYSIIEALWAKQRRINRSDLSSVRMELNRKFRQPLKADDQAAFDEVTRIMIEFQIPEKRARDFALRLRVKLKNKGT